ncbi:Neuropilin-1 [Stylophora pistillata]|uniref:Neuropilin-1 n=1 Tax=Stylophora pistillata TaxID=50429 RepID=A0A2B4SNN0_STYPI|nr:Neuropilin-1 [Stylophora pistillata]
MNGFWVYHIINTQRSTPNKRVCIDLGLGVGSGTIQDGHITSSSVQNASTPAKNGRLNYTSGSSWCAGTNDTNPYLQIDLQTLHIICAVSTQGNSRADQWVKNYTLQLSTNGTTWTDYKEGGKAKVLIGNDDRNSEVKHAIYGVLTRYLRFLPKVYQGGVCMRTEMFGVEKTSACDMRAIGLVDGGKIPDSSFTATSIFNSRYQAQYGRLNKTKAWAPKDENNTFDYLQVDLLYEHIICAVATQGNPKHDVTEWTTHYKIRFSLNDASFDTYKENSNDKVFPGNTDKDSIVINSLDEFASARFIRFVPTQYHGWKSLRVEVYGVLINKVPSHPPVSPLEVSTKEGGVCTDLNLGVGSGTIQDGHITSSSVQNASTPAKNGRLNYSSGSSWCAGTNDTNPYLQIDLQTLHIICAVSTQGNSQADQWVNNYTLQVSTNGTTWTDYREGGKAKVLMGNDDRNSAVKHAIYGVLTRYLRFLPKVYQGGVCMRIEVFGVEKMSACDMTTIGLADGGKIPDSSFTATSIFNSRYQAQYGRLNKNKAWAPKDKNNTNDYLQIDLLYEYIICAVATQGNPKYDVTEWTTHYKIRFSLNDATFETYKKNNNDKVFPGNTDKDSIVINSLDEFASARFIRFVPTQYHLWKSLRVEVYGVLLNKVPSHPHVFPQERVAVSTKEGGAVLLSDPLVFGPLFKISELYPHTLWNMFEISTKREQVDLMAFRIGLLRSMQSLAYPVSTILNASFKEQKLPRSWKCADVTPLPKNKPIKDIKKDLRPISLTQSISKVAEDFIVTQHWKPAVLSKLDPAQFGAIPKSSTTFAFLEMLHEWFKGTDGTGSTARLHMFDYKKAFDLIDPGILVNKLCQLDIVPSVINWIIDFLSDRYQTVKMSDGCVSEWGSLPSGVPQGGCVEYYLGMENRTILDNEISASSEQNGGTPAKNGRLNYTLGSSWCARTSDTNPYLQIDLKTLHIICAVSTQGNSQADQWVKNYTLQLSTNGKTWEDYKEGGKIKILVGNDDRNSEVKHVVYGVLTRYLRFLPKTHQGGVCMRTEVFGVEKTSTCYMNPIGLADGGKIPDSSFTTTSIYNSRYQAQYGRLNKNKAWGPKDKNNINDYLQIHLLYEYIICAVATQGNPQSEVPEWTTHYKIRLSPTDTTFDTYKENNEDKVFPGNKDEHRTVKNSLNYFASAKYIRFVPTQFHVWKILRVEVYGILLTKVPSQPPAAFKLTASSSTSITAHWQLPPVFARHGRIQGFKLFYREISAGSFAFLNIASGSTLGRLVTGLHKYKKYEFQVLAYTSVGDGPKSSVEVERTMEDVPSLPPSDFILTATNSSSISASWQLPPENSTNGIIRGFKLFYKEKGSSGPTCMFLISNPATRIQEVTGLTEYAEYEFQILAFTSVGDGPTITVVFNTKEAGKPIIKDLPKRTITAVGELVVLTCEVSGDPEASVTWTKDGLTRIPRAQLENNAKILIVKDVVPGDSGVYECKAVNMFGESRTATIVIVAVPPRIIEEFSPSLVMCEKQTPCLLSCQATSYIPFNFSWTKDGEVPTGDNMKLSNNSIIVTPRNRRDYGDYLCHATNSFGSTEYKITLLAPKDNQHDDEITGGPVCDLITKSRLNRNSKFLAFNEVRPRDETRQQNV